MNIEDVKHWYPKTFSKKIDYILLALKKLSGFTVSNIIPLTEKKISSLFFIDCSINDKEKTDCISYMSEQRLMEKKDNTIVISPEGLKQIDELQKT